MRLQMTNIRKCPVCQQKLVGRADKKFCSIKCKSLYHYERKQESEQFYNTVEKQLKRNRKILKTYNKAGIATVHQQTLLEEGFNPRFFTHYWKNPKGEVYLFVYEYGFLKVKQNTKNKYVLVQWQSYMEY